MLKVGLKHQASVLVTPELTVPQLAIAFPGFGAMPPVFATAFMVGFIEATCVEALRPFLDLGQGTVGTHIDVNHIAATPVGSTVTAEIELVKIDKRRLVFAVRCRDDVEEISTGRHERFIIDRQRFDDRMAKKTV